MSSEGFSGQTDTADDYLITATADNGRVRALAVRSTALARQAAQRHATWPTATAALGRTLTAGTLLGALLKEEKYTVTIRVQGSGPLGSLIADADGQGGVRGYLQNPQVDLPLNEHGKLDVGSAVGLPGQLHITWDIGLRRPYTGTSELVSGEIGDDLTSYFYHSEQTPSVTALGVLVGSGGQVEAAGGVLVQLLPGASSHWAETLTASSRYLAGVSRQIAQGTGPEDLIDVALAGYNWQKGWQKKVRFQCRCSRERCRRLLQTAARADVQALLAEGKKAEMECHFCRQRYEFNPAELEEMLLEDV